jgi:osmotically-inducible protein OsmY
MRMSHAYTYMSMSMTKTAPARLYALTLALLIGLGLSGCVGFGKCDPASCAGDAKITADVRALIKDHRELGAPAAFRVQTIGGIVYIYGLVDTDMERRSFETLVMRLPDVKDVVNSLDVRNSNR